jgi:hypothetical protein
LQNLQAEMGIDERRERERANELRLREGRDRKPEGEAVGRSDGYYGRTQTPTGSNDPRRGKDELYSNVRTD